VDTILKILHISDNHGDLQLLKSACEIRSDIVVHSGDFFPDFYDYKNDCWDSVSQELWLKLHSNTIGLALEGRPFVFVQGNHDWVGLKTFDYPETKELANSSVTIEGLKFYGLSNTPNLSMFNHFTTTEEFETVLQNIPTDTDVLVPHCPPYGIMDQLEFDERSVGIPNLKERIESTKIRLVLFGHIHEANGLKTIGKTVYSNAAAGWRLLKI
jgi:Icc-related predicted phosphoesterase